MSVYFFLTFVSDFVRKYEKFLKAVYFFLFKFLILQLFSSWIEYNIFDAKVTYKIFGLFS